MRVNGYGYEGRRLGVGSLAMPLLVLALFVGLAGVMAVGGESSRRVGRMLVAGLELGLPLAAGFASATLVSHDPSVELHLTLPTRYRATVVRRLALLTGWTGLVAAATAVAMLAAGLWVVPGPFLVGQLAWLAPLLWFVALGAALALLFRGRAASAGSLAGIWVLQNLFGGVFVEARWGRPWFLFATTYAPGADFWLANRGTLMGGAVAIGLGVWLLLRQSEALLTGGDA